MNDHLLNAIGRYSRLYPNYQIQYISVWGSNDTSIKYRIIGTKGNTQISDIIVVNL